MNQDVILSKFYDLAIAPLLDTLLIFRGYIAEFFGGYLLTFQIISGIVSAILFYGVVWLVIKLNIIGDKIEKFNLERTGGEYDKSRSIKAWIVVEHRMRAGDEANIKMAIIDADKIFDDVLKFNGFKGETMADRMKNIKPGQIPLIDGLWRAHKIRNRIAHESDFHITNQTAEEIIGIYRKTFKDMGLID